ELSGRHRHRMEVPVEAGMVSVIAPPALPLPRAPPPPPPRGGGVLVRRQLPLARCAGPRRRSPSHPQAAGGVAAPPCRPPPAASQPTPWTRARRAGVCVRQKGGTATARPP